MRVACVTVGAVPYVVIAQVIAYYVHNAWLAGFFGCNVHGHHEMEGGKQSVAHD